MSASNNAKKKRDVLHRGATESVLRFFFQHPNESYTADQVAKAVSIPKQVVSSSMIYLYGGGGGMLDKVKWATYKLSATGRSEAERLGLIYAAERPRPLRLLSEPSEVPTAEEIIEEMTTPPTPSDAPVTEPTTIIESVEVEDPTAMTEAVLSMLLPEDYRFNPSHARTIADWQDRTEALIRTLRGTA